MSRNSDSNFTVDSDRISIDFIREMTRFVKNYSGEQISRHRGSVTDIPLHRDQARPEVLSLRMRLFEKSSPRMLRSARAWDTGGIW